MIKAQLNRTRTKRGKREYWYWRLYDTKKNKYLCNLGKHPIDWFEAWKLLAKTGINLSQKEHINIIETFRINQHLSIELYKNLRKIEKEILEILRYHRDPKKPSYVHHISSKIEFNPFQITEELYFEDMILKVNNELKKNNLGTIKEMEILSLKESKLNSTEKEKHKRMYEIRWSIRDKFVKEKLRSKIYTALNNLRKHKLVNRILTQSHPQYVLRKKYLWNYTFRFENEKLTNDYVEKRKALKEAKNTMEAYRRFIKNPYYIPH